MTVHSYLTASSRMVPGVGGYHGGYSVNGLLKAHQAFWRHAQMRNDYGASDCFFAKDSSALGRQGDVPGIRRDAKKRSFIEGNSGGVVATGRSSLRNVRFVLGGHGAAPYLHARAEVKRCSTRNEDSSPSGGVSP